MRMSLIQFVSFFLIFFSIKTNAQVCTVGQLPNGLRNGLVAYFPFCGNTNDISGNNNVGIPNNITFQVDRFGNPNATASFSKANQSHIAFLNNPNFQQTSFTLSAWFNTNTISTGVLGSGNDQFIVGHSPTQWLIGPSYGVTLDVVNNADIFSRMWTQATSWQDINAPRGLISANTWYHIILVYDGVAKIQKFYINGNLIGQRQAELSYFGQAGFFIGGSLQNSAGTIGTLFNGLIDDVGFWSRPLADCEIQQLYTVNNLGFTNNQIPDFNPLSDTLKLCGLSTTLDAGVGFTSYRWSSGEVTSRISPKIGGKYFVTVTNNNGCTATDSIYLSLVNANILQNDTVICNGGSLSLSVDTVYKVINTFGTSLPTNLKNDLVAYYPFNGNANDESGNGNHATVYNARLTTDRFGRANSAYSFSPTDRSSIIPGILNTSMVNSFTYSVWVKPLNTIVVPAQGQAANAASGFPDNTCVIHPIHGQNYGPPTLNTGTGVYVGTNGVYLEEHSDGWEAVPISHQMDLSGWHLINIVYENKIPTLYIDGVFIKKGIPSARQIYASLGPDKYPSYERSGIGAGYIPTRGTLQYFNGDIDDIFYYKRALNANEVSQIFNGALSVKWSTGDTTSKITVSPSSTTKYFVTVSDGITSCTDSVLVKVNNLSSFNPLPDTISQCGSSLILDAGSGYQSYIWNNGIRTSSQNVISSGFYSVIVSTVEGCVANDSTYVSLVTANIIENDTSICAKQNIKLNASIIGVGSNPNLKYLWSTGDSSPSISFTATKTSKYFLLVTDGLTKCSDSVLVSVEVPAIGVRYANQDLIINRPTEVAARNFGKTYLWNPDFQLNSPRLNSPIITPTKQQQYTIKITTDGGCVTVDTVLVRVFPDRNIYVPEGFTPDGDGRNDRLYPIPVGISEMRAFRVYNRWGTLLFDNRNANINNGWDGTYLGTKQPMESYVWIAEGIDIDGKFIRRSGNSILIR